MRHPASGWAEQDPADWTRCLTAAVRQLMSGHGIRPSQVTHLGLASQVDGVVAVDGKLRPLRPAIIWLDRRATDQAAALASQLGTDRIFATTGLNADASHIAPKLMWLRDNEPATFSRARSFPPVGGYLLGWLTGVLAQDHANASSTDQAAALASQLGTDRIFATTGLNADASHIAPKLMWLRDNEPATFSRARSFPPVGGYLLGWLTGNRGE